MNYSSLSTGFCHEHALILYVYLPNDNGDDESVLTVRIWFNPQKQSSEH